MRKVFISVLAALCAAPSFAQHVSEQQALRQALAHWGGGSDGRKKAPGKAATVLAYTAGDESGVQYYIFNDTRGRRFVVVGGDEKAGGILAEGRTLFDADSIPDGFRWYLEALGDGIKAAARSGAPRAKAPVQGRKDIAPLVKPGWAQDWPYNCMLPTGNGGRKFATGCVATAMAQIMHRWKHPEKGTGYKKYTKTNNAGDTYTVEADFENTRYDWEHMRLAYYSGQEYTDEELRAVGTLMYHCGAAVNMTYNYESSAEYPIVGTGLVDHFGYDPGISTEERAKYSDAAWEELIYNELAAGRPVYYNGNNGSSGHAFVCCGYKAASNKFIINFGWGGDVDASLNYLNGFKYHQAIVIGIQPALPTPAYKVRMMKPMEVQGSDMKPRTVFKPTETIRLRGGDYRGMCTKSFNAEVGAMFTSLETGETKTEKKYDVGFNVGDGGWSDLGTVSLATLGMAGEVEITPVYRMDGGDWKPMETAPEWQAPVIEIRDPSAPASVSVAVGESLIGTMYYGGKSLAVPAGITAHTYRLEGNTLVESVAYGEGDVIPAGEAVVVKAAAPGKYVFPEAESASGRDPQNALCGTDRRTNIADQGTKYYVLSLAEGGAAGTAGFYFQSEDGASVANAAHKAYLPVSDGVALAKGYPFGVSTQVSSPVANRRAGVYDLQGRKASTARPGLYIVGGKKALVK